MTNEQQRDEQLWQLAKARAGFKWSLFSYLIINSFLIVVWFFASGPENYFWPIWPILGWGLGLAFQYFNAYQGNKFSSTQEEYERLKKQQS